MWYSQGEQDDQMKLMQGVESYDLASWLVVEPFVCSTFMLCSLLFSFLMGYMLSNDFSSLGINKQYPI